MAIKNTWQVNTCQRETADGYVSKVIYRVIADDGTYKARATGEVDLPKPGTLVPYADLTHDQVIGWVKAKLDAAESGTTTKIEEALKTQLDELKAPTQATGVPWS